MAKQDITLNPKFQRSLCYDCLWCRVEPLTCIAGGPTEDKYVLMDINDLPKTCKKWKENW